jgi:hypothetical protein
VDSEVRSAGNIISSDAKAIKKAANRQPEDYMINTYISQ